MTIRNMANTEPEILDEMRKIEKYTSEMIFSDYLDEPEIMYEREYQELMNGQQEDLEMVEECAKADFDESFDLDGYEGDTNSYLESEDTEVAEDKNEKSFVKSLYNYL